VQLGAACARLIHRSFREVTRRHALATLRWRRALGLTRISNAEGMDACARAVCARCVP